MSLIRAFKRLSGSDAVFISSTIHGANIGHSFDPTALLVTTSTAPILAASPYLAKASNEMCRTTRSPTPSQMAEGEWRQGSSSRPVDENPGVGEGTLSTNQKTQSHSERSACRKRIRKGEW